MDLTSRIDTAEQHHQATWQAAGSDVPVADSIDLLKGGRELRIQHGSQVYRLRLTASEKLILTK